MGHEQRDQSNDGRIIDVDFAGEFYNRSLLDLMQIRLAKVVNALSMSIDPVNVNSCWTPAQRTMVSSWNSLRRKWTIILQRLTYVWVFLQNLIYKLLQSSFIGILIKFDSL